MEEKKAFYMPGGMEKNLLELLKEEKVYLDAPCNGSGNCGKCKVQLIEGVTEPTERERKLLSEEELTAGIRLACQTMPVRECRGILLNSQEEILTESAVLEECMQSDKQKQRQAVKDVEQRVSVTDYGIAIDIGTTTIAAVLVNLATGKNAASETGVNHQRAYGADVISRIKASVEGNGRQLQQILQEDLRKLMECLLETAGIPKSHVKRIVIAANTTMCHLLLGYSCDTLGVAPFQPVNIKLQKKNCREVFGIADWQAKVTILPGISAFVGADIVSGLLACRMQEKEEYALFLDIGTNGEMAVGNKDVLFVTSTAAGPAFEGGNISCGVASVPGAIDKVEILFPYARIHTLGDKNAIGLCGTGVIETVYELLRNRILDENGTLAEQFLEDGYPLVKNKIYLKQQDIREFQVAKAAIRAGMECLLERSGIPKEKNSKVYLAGSFGCHISVEKAFGIGLLPKRLKEQIQLVGNTSLDGARQYLLGENEACVETLASMAKEIRLTTDAEFQEKFLQYMGFTSDK